MNKYHSDDECDDWHMRMIADEEVLRILMQGGAPAPGAREKPIVWGARAVWPVPGARDDPASRGAT